MSREILVSVVYRIGAQTVERDGERYFVTLRNRSGLIEHEVPAEAAWRYFDKHVDEIRRRTRRAR